MQKYQSVDPCQKQTKKTKETKEQGSQSHSCQRWLVAWWYKFQFVAIFPFSENWKSGKLSSGKEKLNFKLANQPAAAKNNKTPNVIWHQNQRKLRKLNKMGEVVCLSLVESGGKKVICMPRKSRNTVHINGGQSIRGLARSWQQLRLN